MNANELSLFLQKSYTLEERKSSAYRKNVVDYFFQVVTDGGGYNRKGYLVDVVNKGKILSRRLIMDLSLFIIDEKSSLHYRMSTGRDRDVTIVNFSSGASFKETTHLAFGRTLRISDEGFSDHDELVIHFDGFVNLTETDSEGKIFHSLRDSEGKLIEGTSIKTFGNGDQLSPDDHFWNCLMLRTPSSLHPAWDYGLYRSIDPSLENKNSPKLTVLLKDGTYIALSCVGGYAPVMIASVETELDCDGELVEETLTNQMLVWSEHYHNLTGVIESVPVKEWPDSWREAFTKNVNGRLRRIHTFEKDGYKVESYLGYVNGIGHTVKKKLKEPDPEPSAKKDDDPYHKLHMDNLVKTLKEPLPQPKKRKRFLGLF